MNKALEKTVKKILDAATAFTPAEKALEKTIDKILDDYDVNLNKIKSRLRTSKICEPRWLIWYLNREFTYQSLPQIGDRYNRDHTSIMNGLKKIEEKHPEKIKFYEKYYRAEKEKEKQLD